MRDIPVIFSAPMVQALISGNKTMTRRLAWTTREAKLQGYPHCTIWDVCPSPWQKVKRGDRLWVRENFWQYGQWRRIRDDRRIKDDRYLFEPMSFNGGNLIFAADTPVFLNDQPRGKFAQTEPAWHLRPNIFLERKNSRLTLAVMATKIEPVQKISEDDARAEGMGEPYLGDGDPPFTEQAVQVSRVMQFRNLWRTLHGADAWDANREVVAISFTVHRCNIDAMKEAA